MNDKLAVNIVRLAAFFQTTGVGTETHGTAFLRHLLLLFHQVDNRVTGVGIKLRGAGAVEFQHIAGELDDGTLHAQAHAKERDLLFPYIPYGLDLALHPPLAKSRCNENPVKTRKYVVTGFGIDFLRRDPFHINLAIVLRAGMHKGFVARLIRIRKGDILAYKSDVDFFGRILQSSQEFLPVIQVGILTRRNLKFGKNALVEFLLFHQERYIVYRVSVNRLND